MVYPLVCEFSKASSLTTVREWKWLDDLPAHNSIPSSEKRSQLSMQWKFCRAANAGIGRDGVLDGSIYLLITIPALRYRAWKPAFISLIAGSHLNYIYISPILSLGGSYNWGRIAVVSFQVCAFTVGDLCALEQRMARDATYSGEQEGPTLFLSMPKLY
jgi:hypothetical protein